MDVKDKFKGFVHDKLKPQFWTQGDLTIMRVLQDYNNTIEDQGAFTSPRLDSNCNSVERRDTDR